MLFPTKVIYNVDMLVNTKMVSKIYDLLIYACISSSICRD